MKRNFFLSLLVLLLVCSVLPAAVSADSSHARIVRLSFIQGDVRFVREFHDDPIADPRASWEVAQLNLPIRQGNAISTGNGRAEVEFESGALAFLGPNTVIEFYDLSLHDGSRITRLILRQGSASFYDRSQSDDYFSVTGGDFSVEVTSHATFRLENFDDGSAVNVQNGRVTILQNDKSTPLEKGQSFTVHANDAANPIVAKAAPSDDFDRWVSNRIQSEQAATTQLQPTSYSGSYVSGYSDLFTYGSWMSVNGFNCWRPFGVGLGWSPFDYGLGNWYMDGNMGWTFIGSSPWGWLPYHYGGWYFSPIYGWVWNPGGLLYGRPMPYRPVTAVFVHNGNTIGVVPMHPSDKSGKTPLNLNQGVYPVHSGTIGKPLTVAAGEKWSVVKNSQSAGFSSGFTAAAAPGRVNRTITAPNSSAREASFGRGSSIVYDSAEHRFVNATQGRVAPVSGALAANELRTVGRNASEASLNRTAASSTVVPSASRASTVAPSSRASAPPSRPSTAPPAPHASVGGSSGGSRWGGSGSSSSGGSVGSSRSSSGSSASSSGSSSHPASSGGAGGRPH